MDTGQKEETHEGTEGRSEDAEGNHPRGGAEEKSSQHWKSEKRAESSQRAKKNKNGGNDWRGFSGTESKGRGRTELGRAGGRGGEAQWRGPPDPGRWGRRNPTRGRGGAAERGAATRMPATAWGRRDGQGGCPSGSDRAPRKHRLGFKALQDLSLEDPSLVAITLSSHPDLKTVLGETKMRQDLTELLCLVLSTALKSRADRVTLQHLANIIKHSGFFQTTLPLYLGGMGSESNPLRRAQYPRHLDNILVIVSEVINIFPASSVQAVSMLVTLFEASINSLRALGVNIQPAMDKKVEGLRALIAHLQERSREGTLCSDKDSYVLLPAGDDAEDQQENFRNIPIYPTPEEFHKGERPFLRQNLTSQRYTSTHIYLDTHFRLLREDFVRPLREGIQQLIRDQMEMGSDSNPLKKKRFDDIRIYFNTQLVAPMCTHSGIAYIVKFDVQPLKFVRWQNSKRLIYGSLVCLSSDNFESFLFATVSDRDPKDLQEGRVQIIFTEESRLKLATIQEQQVFLMVETSAYFEAYRYVLEGLQEQVEADLPFQRYIVECSKNVQPPAYLRGDDVYDLKSIADPLYKSSMQPFSSLKPDAWPEMEKMGLDESQMKALQLALTKELAIIQGPPGTGKTYVGLKVAQALLTNQDLWIDDIFTNEKGPMLIVCYTNHALDQFLEGIYKFQKAGIVRVGGRSNSETLKSFNLRELANSQNFRNHRPSQLRNAQNNVYEELRDAEIALESHSLKLECSLKGVLRETVLQNFISFRHWNSLLLLPTQDGFMTMRERKSNLMEWLGLGSTVVQQRETENAFQGFHPAAAVGMELDDGSLIQFQEEADLMQAERILEDWEDVSSGHRERDRNKKKKDLEESARQLEKQMLAMTLEDAVPQDEQSEDGFQMPKEQRKKMQQKIKRELQKSTAMSDEEEANVLNVWGLDLQDRWRLYRLWVKRYRMELRLKAQQFEREYQDAADRMADVKRHQDLCVLREAKVIGMTTTGAAKYRKVLQQVRPRVVIVEEAAEVLEAHTVTTLSKDCQHLILIGDHQQLRPSATVYELGKNFSLEMSMFERLVKMGLPFVRLDYQHRMRPEIARLLTPHIYAELENHSSVYNYENIKGVLSNLFFVEHTHPEEEINDGKSHQNRHEAKFVVALCRYFLLQDYKPEQITILTTYTGQFNRLRELMPAKEFSGVKVHVVDKYQGEENDIVLLSLVRSNLEGKVGFLSIANRVCVALSRAKKGLFCIGNRENLSQIKLWGNIFHTLRETDKIGKALTLCCQNHPNRLVKASCAEDFQQAPEGGCTEPCQFRLDCGHVCARVCHPYDPEHQLYQCGKPCQKILCDRQHRCPILCHMDCPKKCDVKVEQILPKCQHTQMVPCYQNLSTFQCRMPCEKLLACGHPCTALCGEPCTFKCRVQVTLKLKCGHVQQDACFYRRQEKGPECKAPCNHQLKCGHACQGTCGRCHQGRFHSACSHPCERLLICSHKCVEPCTRNCPPCSRPCENCCVHSKCMRRCGQRCTPCVEPCPWQCPHQSCNRLCHEPCDRPPCTEPCHKILRCGHPCIGLCGDICPNKCRVCDHEEVTEIFFGTEDEPDAFFIQLEDCGHIVEYTAMDKHMNMDDDEQATAGEQVAIKLKECPKCRTPIRKNLRYGSSINRSLAEIEMVKEKINGPQPDVEGQRKLLKRKFRTMQSDFSGHFYQDSVMFTNSLERTNLTTNDLWVLENKMDFMVRVAKLLKLATEKISPTHESLLSDSSWEFVGWLRDRHQRFTDQQVFDLQRELQRLSLLAELCARCSLAEETGQTDKIKDEVQKIREVLETPGQLSEQDEQRVKEALKELNKKVPLSGLGISDEEKKMIVSAMNLAPGHWHKCPNGHVYVITECGGAMERRKCPDCEATIGGASHRLDSGNVVATEMDGAQHSAWSEVNNILNFDRDNFF